MRRTVRAFMPLAAFAGGSRRRFPFRRIAQAHAARVAHGVEASEQDEQAAAVNSVSTGPKLTPRCPDRHA